MQWNSFLKKRNDLFLLSLSPATHDMMIKVSVSAWMTFFPQWLQTKLFRNDSHAEAAAFGSDFELLIAEGLVQASEPEPELSANESVSFFQLHASICRQKERHKAGREAAAGVKQNRRGSENDVTFSWNRRTRWRLNASAADLLNNGGRKVQLMFLWSE